MSFVAVLGVEPQNLNVDGEKLLCKLVVDWLETAIRDEDPVDKLSENVIACSVNLFVWVIISGGRTVFFVLHFEASLQRYWSFCQIFYYEAVTCAKYQEFKDSIIFFMKLQLPNRLDYDIDLLSKI